MVYWMMPLSSQKKLEVSCIINLNCAIFKSDEVQDQSVMDM